MKKHKKSNSTSPETLDTILANRKQRSNVNACEKFRSKRGEATGRRKNTSEGEYKLNPRLIGKKSRSRQHTKEAPSARRNLAENFRTLNLNLQSREKIDKLRGK